MKSFTGYMHGVNLGGWLSQCIHSVEHYKSFISEEDIRKIADMGADHVRLPIDFECIETESGEPLPFGYVSISECIEWCEKYGLNVILDVHKTAGFSFDSKQNTLFDSEPLKLRYLKLWEMLSYRYGRCRNVAFELLNEIVEETPELWNDLSRRAIQVIRKNATDKKIIIGGIQWNSVHTLRMPDKPYDDNIVFNFNFYEPFLFTHQSAPWLPEIPKAEMNYPSTMEACSAFRQRGSCWCSRL